MDAKQVDDFLKLQTLFDKMKTIRRQTKVMDREENENDAEYSWHVAMWALLLRDFFPNNVDNNKVVTMLLIHDLPEIYCGDKLFFAKTEEDDKNEFNAATKLFLDDFPQPLGGELYLVWLEFTNGNSKESQIARAIDYLQPILQNVNSNGVSWKKNGVTLEEVIARKQKGICINQSLTEIFDELIRRAKLIMNP